MTFRRVHSSSKEVSYLPLWNKCSNLKTTCHIKKGFWYHMKFSLWTKLLENAQLEKYIISVAATLTYWLINHSLVFAQCNIYKFFSAYSVRKDFQLDKERVPWFLVINLRFVQMCTQDPVKRLLVTVAHTCHIFSKKLNWCLLRTNNFITAY